MEAIKFIVCIIALSVIGALFDTLTLEYLPEYVQKIIVFLVTLFILSIPIYMLFYAPV